MLMMTTLRGVVTRTMVVAIVIALVVNAAALLSFTAWRTRESISKASTAHPLVWEALDRCESNKNNRVIWDNWLVLTQMTEAQAQSYTDDLIRSRSLGRTIVRGGWIAGIGAKGILAHPACGPLLITREKLVLTRPILHIISFGIFLGSLLIIIPLTYFLLSRPLSTRIKSLRKAAQAIGNTDFAWTPSGTEDLFDQFGLALKRAHDRILSDNVLLKKRAEMLEQHVSEISHDIRKPLSTVRFSLDGIDHNHMENKNLRKIHAELEYIEQLIENLSINTILRGRLLDGQEKESFDLGEAVEQVGIRAMVSGRKKNMAVNYAAPSEPVMVRGYYMLAMRALSNITDNAIRHGPKKGKVAILLSTGTQKFYLTVQDNGKGFDPKIINNRSIKGRKPLGLRITRSCIEHLGWSINIQSGPSGTKVIISGPVAIA